MYEPYIPWAMYVLVALRASYVKPILIKSKLTFREKIYQAIEGIEMFHVKEHGWSRIKCKGQFRLRLIFLVHWVFLIKDLGAVL